MKKDDKTNVMRVLDSKKIEYKSHSYEPDTTMTGEEIAAILGEDADKVFKTLVTQAKSGAYYVFVVPVKAELDFKKAAQAADTAQSLVNQVIDESKDKFEEATKEAAKQVAENTKDLSEDFARQAK